VEIGPADQKLSGCGQAGQPGTDDHDVLSGRRCLTGRRLRGTGTTRLGWRRWHGTKGGTVPRLRWEPAPRRRRRSVMRPRRNALRPPTSLAATCVVALTGLVALSACSGGSDTSGSSDQGITNNQVAGGGPGVAQKLAPDAPAGAPDRS
jgi:hypothetical protein